MISKPLRPCLLLALGAVLAVSSGCLKVGPDYARPDLPVKPPGSYQEAAGQAGPYKNSTRWWKEFGDPELNRLVEQALKHNLDLAQATARVDELAALFSQARAARYPQIDIKGSGAKQRSQTLLAGAAETESYNLAVAATYEIDLWGRLARLEEASRSDLLNAEETRRTIAQTVVANVVVNYLTVQTQERRLQVTEASINAYRNSMEFVEGRYSRGLTSELALRQSRRILANAKAVVPALRQELGKAQHALAVLTGEYPKASPARRLPADYYKALPPVPPGLPSELLMRRPDLQAAEANMQALNARIGSAKAARFPTISLTAGWGYASTQLEQLIRPQNELWNLTLGILAPVFDAGLREARQRQAEARYRQGVASWAKSVLTAFSEVEDTLLTRKEQLARRELVKVALEEAVATQEAAQRRYIRGLSDYLQVLEAQFTRYSLEDQLVLTEFAILSNRVSLHRALGGGWDQLEQTRTAKENQS